MSFPDQPSDHSHIAKELYGYYAMYRVRWITSAAAAIIDFASLSIGLLSIQ